MRAFKQSLHHPSRASVAAGMRLPHWQRRSFYAVFGILLLSGIAWLAAHFFLRTSGAFGPTIHPLEPWSMKLHGAAAMLALWLVGTLLQLHIRRGLAAGRNLSAGWSMIGLLFLLSLTGYALYYVAGEESRPFWSVAHWAGGLLLPLLIWLHVATGRKTAAR